ncbi:MAG: methyltransferase domain-containing protein [Oscillospiraceae bacterium]|nr:methyltransferase domain-containing protein [Oscillospiraceae bacterium]
MKSLFRCPVCAAGLAQEAHRYICPRGHSYDLSAAGYTHLLPANQKHSKNPGDDKDMVAARCAFLDKGYYAPFRDALCDLAVELTSDSPSPILLDSGCGEGYYTTALHNALCSAGRDPAVAGIDISKFALRKAAKKLPQGEFAVASAYHLPLADGAVHLLTNIFSPLSADEFARVLAPGGHFLYAVPSARHLWQMKQVLYDAPYENPVKREDYPGFQWLRAVPLRYAVTLDSPEDIRTLFAMTPYAWKTPKAGVDRLLSLERLETEIGFDIHVYRRTADAPAKKSPD